jgi:hypothetical protein
MYSAHTYTPPERQVYIIGFLYFQLQEQSSLGKGMCATITYIQHNVNLNFPNLIPPHLFYLAMAKSAAYKLLKEHVTAVELAMKSDLKWFATMLNTDEFPVLNDDLARALKEPASLLQPDQKATKMFNSLQDWVDGNPSGLGKFEEETSNIRRSDSEV